MTRSAAFLSPADAAARLGVSAKALRLYEQRGLLDPGRTPAGWRIYGPAQLQRAEEIAALRALGFSLEQVARVIGGDAHGLEPALAAHQKTLEDRLRSLSGVIERIRGHRAGLAAGRTPTLSDLARVQDEAVLPALAFNLPWPWGGERFELREVRALTYIVGPLFSGKTRLAQRLAETLAKACFVGLERDADGAAQARVSLAADPRLAARVEQTLAWLAEDGAKVSDALLALVTWLERDEPGALVIDMIEQRLEEAAQLALIAHLRRGASKARPLFMLTRSNAILDLASVSANETIILCPANHSMPIVVAPHPGAPGYEAAASCLASPDVRARSEGVIAWRPPAA